MTATAPRPDEEQLAERLWDARLRADVAGRVAQQMLTQRRHPLPDPWRGASLADGVVLWVHLGALTAASAPTVSTGRIEAL